MFRIGDFSKISQVPISQLRYYDEIGLFQPAEIDRKTGYRYYNATQLPKLNRIIALKELGLSLDQVGPMIQDDVVVDEIRGMLALKKSQIEQTLQEEVSRLKIVEARIRQIEQEGEVHVDDVVIKSIPSHLYLSMRLVLPNLFGIRKFVHELKSRLPLRVGAKNLDNFTVVFHNNAFQIEIVDVEMGYLLNNSVESPLSLPSGDQIIMSELPAVDTAATAVRLGTFENGFGPYSSLGRWVEENNYMITGPIREKFIEFPTPPKGENAVVELQIPVQPVNL